MFRNRKYIIKGNYILFLLIKRKFTYIAKSLITYHFRFGAIIFVTSRKMKKIFGRLLFQKIVVSLRSQSYQQVINIMDYNSLSIKNSGESSLTDKELIEVRFRRYVATKLKCSIAKISPSDKEVMMFGLVNVIGIEPRAAASLMRTPLSTSYRYLSNGYTKFRRLSRKSPFVTQCLQFLDYMYDTVHHREISVNFKPGNRSPL